jgi:uncharacterized membrane protein YczE
MKKLIKLLIGTTLSSFGIAMVTNSCLGTYAITTTVQAISNWGVIPFGIANLLIEIGMISYATYKGEGLGVTAIVNAVLGSIMISTFLDILPTHPLMIIGVFIVPFAWAMMGSVGWGDTGSNILMRALMKKTGKSIVLIRTIEETFFLIIGFLGAREYVTIFSVLITFGTPFILKYIYNLLDYKPAEVEHHFISFRQLIRKDTH